MEPALVYRPRNPEDFPRWSFRTIDVEYDSSSESVWMYYKADGTPYFNLQMLTDMADLRESLRALFASRYKDVYPIRYVTMASRIPGVFNLGGDLAMFADAIRNGERDMLRGYAHACIDVVYGLFIAFGLPVVTLSVISGQALGGGLEAALAQDFLLADEEAKIGVPEVAFNTFPGMGAISLLTRRLGPVRAEEIIETGRVYSGRQMYEFGVVDMVVPEGTSHTAALTWMRDGGEKGYLRRLAIAKARRYWFPVSHQELIRITDLWADCSSQVTKQDIRHMDRLVAAQRKISAAR